MHLKPKTGSVSTLTKTMGNAVISLLGTFFIFTLYRLATDHFKTLKALSAALLCTSTTLESFRVKPESSQRMKPCLIFCVSALTDVSGLLSACINHFSQDILYLDIVLFFKLPLFDHYTFQPFTLTTCLTFCHPESYFFLFNLEN